MSKPAVTSDLSDVRGSLIALGIIQLLLGTFCILLPFVAGSIVIILSGILLLLSGITEIGHTARSHGFGVGAAAYSGGVLSIPAAILIILWPWIGLSFLALAVAVYLFVDATQRIVVAAKMHPGRGWTWMLLTGVLAVLLGVAILVDWPLSGDWAVGTLLGVFILSRGWNMLMLTVSTSRQTDNAT
jgi:uncharacterized membrane protein HdeD (DUF308 family)